MTTGLFTSGNGSVNALRVRLSHQRAAIRHMREGQAQLCGGITLACRDNILPPADAYDNWLAATRDRKAAAHSPIDGRKLRRLVQMRRNGCTHQEVANIIGCSSGRACKWWSELPSELR